MTQKVYVWLTNRGTCYPIEVFNKDVFKDLITHPFDIIEDANEDNWTRDDLTGYKGLCAKVECNGHTYNIADEGILADLMYGDFEYYNSLEDIEARITEDFGPADANRMTRWCADN